MHSVKNEPPMEDIGLLVGGTTFWRNQTSQTLMIEAHSVRQGKTR
jgi:hypothetical protein